MKVMPKTEAQKRATAKYDKKTYDYFYLQVRKDVELNCDFIREYAESRGESINSFVKRAIEETIANDRK